MKKTILKNIIFAFGSQIVSLGASLAVTFLIPPIIGVKDFAYWQLFLTYVTYVNLSRFGLIDGLYLRIGGKKYEELDFNLLSHERRLYGIFQFIISCMLVIVILFFDFEKDRQFVLISCCVCIVIINLNNYLNYILQAVNRTNIYSISVILQNITWFIAIAIIYVLKIYSYKVIIVLYILGHIFAGIFMSIHAYEVVQHRKSTLGFVFNDIKENIKCGIKLMIATYAGTMIIGSARMIIDAAWGVEVFGYFSFSLTLANVFLTFISQVSIVIFPALRTVKKEKFNEAYFFARNALSLILPIVMMGYFPITIIVRNYMPQYEQSLTYLPIFLPICNFDGKMQMLCSNFFKSLRKEALLLKINIGTLICSVVIALIGVFFIKNIEFVAFGLLFTIALRSVLSEVILSKIMHCNIICELLQEIGIVVIFIFLSKKLSVEMIFIIFSFVYAIYLSLNWKRVKQVINIGFRK